MTEYEIFTRCFPELPLTEQQFLRLSGLEHGAVFREDGGFVLTDGGSIRLLCVIPEERGNGLGTSLLARAEEHISTRGHSHAELGGTSSQLLIGAPESSADFFRKRGYVLVAEMYGTPEMLREAPPADGAEFWFFRGDGLAGAVAAVDEDWVQYFNGGEIFCGMCGNDIASFCIVEDDVECIFSSGKTGSIGCVGTVPGFRRHGIGLKMVELAARELYSQGCERIFIHYTGVYDWYAKIGFRTGLMLWLGGKELHA